MAELQVTPRFAIIFTFFTIIFTLFAFLAILTSEGRTMKLAWKDGFCSIDNGNQMYEQASQFLTQSLSPWNGDRSDAGKQTVSSPTVHVQVVDLGKPEAVYRDDLPPTNPGSSPRVGHSFVGLKKEAVRPKSMSR
ncbi:uncharacterized protein J3R85_015324 [Psidium guajava]|nr:uncharacterized protein J3R85_015324 [Psidium guajava]